LPDWYRTAAAASWRFIVIVAAAGAVIYALVYLHIVVLPIIIALLASTLLLPPVRWMKEHGVPDALAAAGAMLGAFLLIVAIGTAVAPSIGDQFGELRPRAEDGVRDAADVLKEPPFNVSESEIRERVDDGIAKLRDRATKVRVPGNREYNPGWHTALDLASMLTCSEVIAMCAIERKESRGGHFREDFPDKDKTFGACNIVLKRTAGGMQVQRVPIPDMPAELKQVIEEMVN